MNRTDQLKLRRDGWSVERTNGGHLRLVHADASAPVFAAATPGDQRAWRNLCAQMRRVLPAGPAEVKPLSKPVEKRSPPKPADDSKKIRGLALVEVQRVTPCNAIEGGAQKLAVADVVVLGIVLRGVELKQGRDGALWLSAPRLPGVGHPFTIRDARLQEAVVAAIQEKLS